MTTETLSARKADYAAAAMVLLSAAGVVIPKLALFVALGTLVLWLSLPAPVAPRVRYGFIAAAVLSTLGVLRFVITEAVPGLVQGGNTAASKTAISRLREISFAQDVMRQRAYVDPDGDGIGSAATIAELTGARALRGQRRLDPPPLSPRYASLEKTQLGPAALVGGYLFRICLPTTSQGWTAEPEGPIDEERAERRFVAYAWPMASGGGLTQAFFIDQHENIRVSENQTGKELTYAGPFHAPDCAAAMDEAWPIWRGKKPRDKLPGDRP